VPSLQPPAPPWLRCAEACFVSLPLTSGELLSSLANIRQAKRLTRSSWPPLWSATSLCTADSAMRRTSSSALRLLLGTCKSPPRERPHTSASRRSSSGSTHPTPAVRLPRHALSASSQTRQSPSRSRPSTSTLALATRHTGLWVLRRSAPRRAAATSGFPALMATESPVCTHASTVPSPAPAPS